AVAFLHGLDGLLARWVQQTDQTQQDERAGKVAGTETAGLHLRVLEPGQCQHTLTLGGEPVRLLREAPAVEGGRLPPGSLLERAPLEEDLRSALDQQHAPAVRRLVESRHELVLGLERDRIDAWKRRLLGLPVHAELGREGIEGALGRIAFHLPRAVLLEQL